VARVPGRDELRINTHYTCLNDVTSDGLVDFNDIDQFVECLINEVP